MNYLAIKDTKGKGVYQYNTKDERSSILKSLGLGKNAGKVFTDKKEALDYAKVKEVANREQQVVADSPVNKKNPASNTKIQAVTKGPGNAALNMLLKCKEKGFDFVSIKLTDGTEFDVILREFTYLTTTNSINCSPRIKSRYVYDDEGRGTSTYYAYPISSAYRNSDIKSFDDFRTIALKTVERYNKELEEYKNKENYSISAIFKDIHEYCSRYFGMDDFTVLGKLKATKIEGVDNFLFFDKVSIVKRDNKCSNSNVDFYVYVEDFVVNDYILNTDYILSMTPRKSKWKVTDKEFIKAYESIKTSNEN